MDKIILRCNHLRKIYIKRYKRAIRRKKEKEHHLNQVQLKLLVKRKNLVLE